MKMSNEEKEKMQKSCEELADELVQAFKKVVEMAVNIWNEIKKIATVLVQKIGKFILNYYINMIKSLNNKKACKILHIWQHTKNRRIRKKQVKRLNKYLLSYMPF